jgi:hypothetical protein
MKKKNSRNWNRKWLSNCSFGGNERFCLYHRKTKRFARFCPKKLRELHLRPKFQSFGDGFAGLPTFAPFDKILVTCGAEFFQQNY